MNLGRTLAWLGQRFFGREESPPTPEETRQFDLLLDEIRAQEQQLPANHWTLMAQTFEERVSQGAGTPRPPGSPLIPHWKPYTATLLPMAGLVVLGLAVYGTGQHATDGSLIDTTALPAFWGDDNNEPITAEPLRSPEVTSRAETSHPAPQSHSAAKPPSLVFEPSERAASQRSFTPRRVSVPRVNDPRASLDNNPNAASADNSRTPAKAALPLERPTESTARTVSTNPKPSPAVSPTSDDFAEQLLTLKKADKALKSGNTSEAKEKLKRDFSPQLLLHANALRAVSACQSSDKTTGQRYLKFQEKRHPHSPYLDRIRRACGPSSGGQK